MAGYAPLHLALRDFEFDQSNSLSTLRLLLNHDASLSMRDSNSQLPEDYIRLYTDVSVQRAVNDVIREHTSPVYLIANSMGLTSAGRSRHHQYPR